jgi:hypothetical protein
VSIIVSIIVIHTYIHTYLSGEGSVSVQEYGHVLELVLLSMYVYVSYI